ncbi:MAG: NusG domain II-containing protein [Sporolactobacillus sp.]
MYHYFSMIKRWDIIIICLLVLLSFLPLGVFSYVQAKHSANSDARVAVISVDSKKVRQVMLSGNTQIEKFDIRGENGDLNTIEVRKDRIRIKSANCPDQICVRTGFISKPGETIVCLPHRLVIEIQSENNPPEPVIISS